MVNVQDQQEWSNYYGRQGLSVFFTDANAGKGITKVLRITARSHESPTIEQAR